MSGEESLRQFELQITEKQIHKISDSLYLFQGFGYYNACAVIADHSVILVDPLGSLERGQNLRQELEKITDKPVRTIIYTHAGPYNTGGSGAFADTVEEIIAFRDRQPTLPYKEKLDDIRNMYAIFCNGSGLTEAEAMSQGIGKRIPTVYGQKQVSLKPTTIYEEDTVFRKIDGTDLVFQYAPGDKNDQCLIYLPKEDAVLCGSNYFSCFPASMYASHLQYKDITLWIEALNKILSYNAQYLLPGHTDPICGKREVRESVELLRDCLEYIFFTTLDNMNSGYSLDECLQRLNLPEKFQGGSLQEFHGVADWLVKDIYTAYLGWFNGLASAVMPAKEEEMNAVLLELITEDVLSAKIDALMEEEEYQVALQLCEISKDNPRKKKALEGRARQMTSSIARHFLLQRASEL